MKISNNSDTTKKIEDIRKKIHNEVEKYLDSDNLTSPVLARKMISWENELSKLYSHL